MATDTLQEPGPKSLYVLLVLVIGICCYFFFIGTATVRLWFYKGALGPAPEKFLVIKVEHEEPHHHVTMANNDGGTRAETMRNRRMTVFTHASLSVSAEDMAPSTALDPRSFSTATTMVNLQNFEDEDFSEFKNPKTRAYIAEERRISRLPAFDADDCGTGDWFPDIPLTNKPIESNSMHILSLTPSQLGLTQTNRRDWLVIDEHYIEYHDARTHLLSRNRSSCIHVTSDGEAACRELLQEVTSFLVETHRNKFSFQTKHRRKHILNELTREDFELEPGSLERHPLEVVARLCGEDFMVWGRSESTRTWYLEASTTLFPSGYIITPYMGKSVDVMVRGDGNGKSPMIPWSTLPSILALDLPTLSPYSHTGPLALRQLFIQTRPHRSSLASSLHIPRPVDFFAGNIANLHPSELLVRTETQMFARLPKTGAVVVTTRTSTETLSDVAERMNGREKKAFMMEVEGWGNEEARFKGRELWIGVVERCLKGQ
ncbi:hypothetical protein G6011_05152 [Alternaria panax]|uniref:Uncharacterized protein n=1 Tax=Alternaria panax TaxID=48097 RepID=A0AAD4FCW7_9PLEO|nr:hypothetical protein G6011_05152 [Alternaria panax]